MGFFHEDEICVVHIKHMRHNFNFFKWKNSFALNVRSFARDRKLKTIVSLLSSTAVASAVVVRGDVENENKWKQS